ncbi:MAG: hypothetical protein KDC38_16265 [Planctomycetes bacterium]|nr:hypothetical protein [Planctomycetota bacterium]
MTSSTTAIIHIVLTSIVLVAITGCVSGDYRRLSLGENLTEGDLAHYRARAEHGYEPVEEYSASLPFWLVPVVARFREASADKVGGGYHFHFEDTFATLLIASTRSETANYDDRGRSTSFDRVDQVLLGLARVSTGHRRLEDGTTVPIGGWSFLWRGIGYEKTSRTRTIRFLWIPFSWDAESE